MKQVFISLHLSEYNLTWDIFFLKTIAKNAHLC